MPFDRPSLAALVAQSRSLLAAKLGTTAPLLDRTPEAALAHMCAGLCDGVWGAAAHIADQIFPSTASEIFLARHAADRGVVRKEGESLEDWRQRVVAAWATPEAGGTEADIVAWALAVPGVGRVWLMPAWGGLGTYGVAIANAGAEYDRSATLALAAEVQAALEARPPAGVTKHVVVPDERRIRLRTRIQPYTQALADAVQDAIHAHLATCEPGGRILWSQLRRVIASVDGIVDHRLVDPYTDVQLPRGALPVLGDAVVAELT